MKTNPRTGLREGFDTYYNLPHVHQRGIGRLRFDGQLKAVHTAPYRPGLTLDFYARLQRSDELVVTFHGANDITKNRYPVFARVRSLAKKAPAMMAFSDPTMLLDPQRKMLISWYLGGPGWDPLQAVLQVVRKAQGKTGARHIAFIGGSGGGFAALRASAMVRGSMAFVQDPQTNIAAYSKRVTDVYFETVWKGWNSRDLLQAFPERFDMTRHYQSCNPENFVYYAQNASDFAHVRKHMRPFQEAQGIRTEEPMHRGVRRIFNVYNGEVDGHGQIQPHEFDVFYEDAFDAWRSYRGTLRW